VAEDEAEMLTLVAAILTDSITRSQWRLADWLTWWLTV